MKIPESIRINGVEYAVEYVENLRSGNDLCYGTIENDQSVIRLSKTDGTEHQRRCVTLLHEILHGIIYQQYPNGIEDEERIVTMLAKGLYQVLQDNGARLFDLKEVEK